jgi:hypothetical protein
MVLRERSFAAKLFLGLDKVWSETEYALLFFAYLP